MRPSALVVLEPGGEWPSSVIRADVDVIAVVEPHSEEGSLTRAVQERVARLGRPVALAVLACNAEANDAATGRRVAITRALLKTVLDTERGHLVINAAGRSTSALRHQLIGLTETLSEGLRGSSSSVTLRFGGASPVRGLAAHPSPAAEWATESAVA
jgi:hypothetical protein